jgi:hypothetical protein
MSYIDTHAATDSFISDADDYAELAVLLADEEAEFEADCDAAHHEGVNDGMKDQTSFGLNYQPHQYPDMEVRKVYIRAYNRGRLGMRYDAFSGQWVK